MLARFLYALRGSRQTLISADLLGEPGWDMLLDLFIASADSRRLSVSALCIGSRSAAATALRYLGLLEEHGLAERVPDANDARRCFVALTGLGQAKMEQLLGAALGRTASDEIA